MNQKQEDFCQHYVRFNNATRAAKEAGYSEKTAYSIGGQLLKKVEIADRVAVIRAERWKSLHMGPDEVLAEVARMARFTMEGIIHITPDGDPYYDLSKATPDQLACITEAKIEDFIDGREVDENGETIKREVRRVTVKAPNKLGAVNLVMKHHGLLKDNVTVTLDESFAEVMERQQRKAREARAKAEADEV